MKISLKFTLIFSFLQLFLGCKEKTEPVENNVWKKNSQVEKAIKNVNFTFPSEGFAFENREKLVEKCFNAMKSNSELIALKEFNDTIFIRFVSSREEMIPFTGATPKGTAYSFLKTLYVVANHSVKPPIKHELMYLISMIEWTFPPRSSLWMNEGLATYAEDNCSGWKVTEIYRYLLENDELIPMDLIVSEFQKHPENFTYHQSGYIVEYLLTNFSIEQFSRLWKSGFDKFEEVYGLPFETVKTNLENDLMAKYPKVPNIDPEMLYEDCE